MLAYTPFLHALRVYLRPQSSELGVNALFLRQLLEDKAISKGLKTWQLKQEVVLPRTQAKRCALVKVLDAQYTGRATVFVSHAYSYAVEDSIEVMLRYEESHPNSFFWVRIVRSLANGNHMHKRRVENTFIFNFILLIDPPHLPLSFQYKHPYHITLFACISSLIHLASTSTAMKVLCRLKT